MFRQRDGVNRRHVMVVHVDADGLRSRLSGQDRSRPRGRSGSTKTERGDAAGEEVAPRRTRRRGHRTAARATAEKPVARRFFSARNSS
jgi:hypothetical protein